MADDKALRKLVKDLTRLLAPFDGTSAILVDVRIFDGSHPEAELMSDWDILHDEQYGENSRHRLKVGRMFKGVPI
jgi:hypothetical protein